MEEKERYKWSQDVIVECPYEDYDYIVDTKNNIIFSDDNYFKLVDLLNQQDKRIKELEGKILIQLNNNADNVNFMENQRRENQQLKQQLENTEESYNRTMAYLNTIRSELLNLPKKIVKEIKNIITEIEFRNCRWIDKQFIYDKLDRILKKYEGEDE